MIVSFQGELYITYRGHGHDARVVMVVSFQGELYVAKLAMVFVGRKLKVFYIHIN